MSTKDININIMMEEGDVLGTTPSENLVITRVQHGTLAEGHIQEGDKIIKVNGVEPRDVNHFYRLIIAAGRKGHLNIVVRRDQKEKDVLHDAKVQVPQERLGKLRIRDGFIYKVVNMVFHQGDKIGLGIKDYMNCVVVTKCPEGTMAGQVFKVGDQICDVDNVRVTDKGVAQTLIVSALKTKQEVSMVVASPESAEARKWVEESLVATPVPQQQPPQEREPSSTRTAPLAQPEEKEKQPEKPSAIVCFDPPSIRLKADVRRIALEEIERRRSLKDEPLRSIIRASSTPGGAKRVSFNAKVHDEHLIVNENPNVPLRPVK